MTQRVKSMAIAMAGRLFFEKIEYTTPQSTSLQVLALYRLISGQGRLQSGCLSILLP